MLNHITIMGRLTRDPELRRTGTGVAVTNFALAVDRDFADKLSGEKETDFIECVAWKNTAEFVDKYFAKGRMAVVSGRLQVRKWNDKDNKTRYTTEVLAENVYFGDSKPAESAMPSVMPTDSAMSGFVPPVSNFMPPASDFAMLTDDDAQLPF